MKKNDPEALLELETFDDETFDDAGFVVGHEEELKELVERGDPLEVREELVYEIRTDLSTESAVEKARQGFPYPAFAVGGVAALGVGLMARGAFETHRRHKYFARAA